MKEGLLKFKNWIDKEMEGTHFIIVWVFFTLLNSLFGFDLWYYSISAVVLLYLVFGAKKYYPVYTVISIYYMSPSKQNNPGANENSIFFPEHGMIYIIFLLVLLSSAVIYRIIKDYKKNGYFPKLMIGDLVLGIFLILGGVGYAEYTPLTLLFGFIVFAAMGFFYFIGIIPLQEEEIPEYYYYKLCFYSALNVAIQVIWVYLNNQIIVDGDIINRYQIWFGWANYNGSGCMLAMLMPVAIFLATKPKVGWLYYIGCCFCELVLYLNQSRDAFTIGTILFLLASIVAFFRSDWRSKIVIGMVILGGIGLFTYLILGGTSYLNKLITDFDTFFDEGGSGGRVPIYKVYWDLFKQYPIFGTGFYSTNTVKWGTVDYDFFPALAHNTWLQMLGSCGLLGMLAYLFHRVQTLILTFRKLTIRKLFYFFGVLGIILTSIIDCHFFNLGPSLTYAMLLALIELEDKREKRKEV